MELFLLDIISKYPVIGVVFGVIGALVVIAQIVVAITPGKSDDEILSSFESKLSKIPFLKTVYDFIISFSPIQKSESKGFELSSKSVGK